MIKVFKKGLNTFKVRGKWKKGRTRAFCRKIEKGKTYFEHHESKFYIKLLVTKFVNRFYRVKWKRPAKPMSGLRIYNVKYNWYKNEHKTCLEKRAKYYCSRNCYCSVSLTTMTQHTNKFSKLLNKH